MVSSLNLHFQVTQIRYWKVSRSSARTFWCRSCGRDSGRVCCGRWGGSSGAAFPGWHCGILCRGASRLLSQSAAAYGKNNQKRKKGCCQTQSESVLCQEGSASWTAWGAGGDLSRGRPCTGYSLETGRAHSLPTTWSPAPDHLLQISPIIHTSVHSFLRYEITIIWYFSRNK